MTLVVKRVEISILGDKAQAIFTFCIRTWMDGSTRPTLEQEAKRGLGLMATEFTKVEGIREKEKASLKSRKTG